MTELDQLKQSCVGLLNKLCDKTVGVLEKQGIINEKDNAEFGSQATLTYLFNSPEAKAIYNLLEYK